MGECGYAVILWEGLGIALGQGECVNGHRDVLGIGKFGLGKLGFVLRQQLVHVETQVVAFGNESLRGKLVNEVHHLGKTHPLRALRSETGIIDQRQQVGGEVGGVLRCKLAKKGRHLFDRPASLHQGRVTEGLLNPGKGG